MLDGIGKIPELVSTAKEAGMESLAITDHGSMYGAVEFYSECKRAGIKPIIGCEVYVAHSNRFEKGPSERSPYHLVLLAQNNIGYQNLMYLVTKSHVEGFHYRPRIDKDLLEERNDGLIVLSGCPSAEIPRYILDNNIEQAEETANWFNSVFNGRFFLEIQRHANVPGLDDINTHLIQMSEKLNIPLVVTNDSHYVHKNESHLQDIYIAIQTNTTINDEKRLRMEDDSYYIKTPEEMWELFSDQPKALENTQIIADMCDVELGFGQTHLPRFDTPGYDTADDYLRALCVEGLEKRYYDITEDIQSRLDYELDVIRETNFGKYFLVVWDIISFVRNSDIVFAVRGSAAASLVLYCLGITDVDPLKYKLVFERFLNLERKEMPDIDMDFQDDRRDEVLNYVIDKYGEDKVAQIITFGRMAAKASLRDVGRGLGIPYGEVDKLAKLVPFKSRTIQDALDGSEEFRQIYNENSIMKNLIDNAQGLEGTVHHISIHAAGVLISENPLTETVPLQRPSRATEESKVLMTQYSMDHVAKLGLLKMDFLGLTNLTILDKCLKLINAQCEEPIELANIPLDDTQTFEVLGTGKTTDIFQLESAGMQKYIEKLKPSNLGDIAAMIALYRPGPMEHIDTFIDAKHGKTPIIYPDESLKTLLDETYGVIVYQDQVLRILQQFAGYTLGEADIVRKAMGKKIHSLMMEERERFVLGSQNMGYSKELSEEVFNLIEPFAGYAFNKAHSVSYALISYWTAYFKTHYKMEYMASVLNAKCDNPEKMITSILECNNLKIKVAAPDINICAPYFDISTTESEQINFGLSAIKNVGMASVTEIAAERDNNGLFESIDDFCTRVDSKYVNRRTLESLVKVGAFDAFGNRGSLFDALESMLATIQLESKIRNSGQTKMFEMEGDNTAGSMAKIPLNVSSTPDSELLLWEEELLGLKLSTITNAAVQSYYGVTLDSTAKLVIGSEVSVLGIIESKFNGVTKSKNEEYLRLDIKFSDGNMTGWVWPQSLKQTQLQWIEGVPLKITGKVRQRGDSPSFQCERAESMDVMDKISEKVDQLEKPPIVSFETDNVVKTTVDAKPQNVTVANGFIAIKILESEDSSDDAHKLREAVKLMLEYPGSNRVVFKIVTLGKMVTMDLPVVTVSLTDDMVDRLIVLLGPDSVEVSDSHKTLQEVV
jgi:DNA polymerase III subunit alpha